MGSLDTWLRVSPLVLVSELGDRTMVCTAMLSAACGSPLKALLVSAAAYLTANAPPLLALNMVYRLISAYSPVLRVAVNALFIAAGLYMLARGEKGDGARQGGSIYSYYLLITLSELGDKTQLATIGGAIETGEAVQALAAGLLGYVAANIISVAVVSRLPSVVKPQHIRTAGALLFIAFGLSGLLALHLF